MEKNETLILFILAIVLIFIFSGFGMMGFSGYGMGGMMQWMFGTGFGFMGIFMLIIPVLIIILFILAILWLVKQLQTPNRK